MFGDVVRAHRRRLGLTQEELAEKSGLSTRSIGKIEAGRIDTPRPATARLLANAFGLAGAERDHFCQASGAEATGPSSPHVPAQLPPDVSAFVGREEALARLDAMLAGTADQLTAMVISAVSGTAGVGKTALAVHWAQRARSRFPDGQLYLNLRGYDPDQPMAPADALARILTALGVPGPDIPVEVDERAARYRTETARRRLLIVLDNASSVEQVRPLLPGTARCAVVVTSRDSLAGLVAVHGAQRLVLDLLPLVDAIALLRRLIGQRVDFEPVAAATLAGQCARLPLALRVAAELAISRPGSPLSDLVTELADHQQRLHLLDADGDPRAAVAAVFSWSIQHLPPDAARTFRLLGSHPGPDLDAYAVAAMVDTSLPQARLTLSLLARANVIQPTTPNRYGLHDLLRAYAIQLSAAEDDDDQRRSVLSRLFDYYLAATVAAMDGLYPAEVHQRPRFPPVTTPIPNLTALDTARAWLEIERPCLAAVAAYTAAHGWPIHTVWLSTVLFRYLDGGNPTDALNIHGHARRAAQQVGDPLGEAQALRGIGAAHLQMGRYGPALDDFEQALVLFGQAGDRIGEARALGNLGVVEERLGRYGSAAERYERALILFREAGDRTGEATGLTNLGIVETRLGRYGLAAEHQEQALTLYREAGDQTGEARALINLGAVEMRLGRYGPAAERQQRALHLYRQLGITRGEAHARDNLGVVHARLGQPEQAAEHFEQALTLFRQAGDRDSEAWALIGLGEAADAGGHLADAQDLHSAALTIAAEIGARDQQARAHTGLGHVFRALGDLPRARQHYEQALRLNQELGSPDADAVHEHLARLEVEDDPDV